MNTFPIDKQATFFLPGRAGKIEVATTFPDEENANTRKIVGIVCHPDPKQEGTMSNKVVTTVARALDILGFPTVRFNYRGVGQSEGGHSDTSGELQDLLTIIDWVKKVLPDYQIGLSGFSFGSYIAAAAANQRETAYLLTIAPPVTDYDYNSLKNIRCPWMLVQGGRDEVVDPQAVIAFAEHPPAPLKLIVFENAEHFFHGKLIQLRAMLVENLLNLL